MHATESASRFAHSLAGFHQATAAIASAATERNAAGRLVKLHATRRDIARRLLSAPAISIAQVQQKLAVLSLLRSESKDDGAVDLGLAAVAVDLRRVRR